MIILTLVNVSSAIISIILLVGYFVYIGVKILRRMDPEDAKFMRTDRRPGTLDVHPSLIAIVLNYELEVQILGQNETVLYGEKQNLKKIIELPMLNTRTDCNTLAKEVLAQCDLIHPSRLVELEQTIFYLKKRKTQNTNKDTDSSGKNTPNEHQEANINSLNEYIELLYDGIPEKIRASMLILQLAREPENLESLSKNETVLSALTRVLREDWKKSIVLSTNLIFIFFCFSTYSCFHHVILHYKIGSLCMNVIGYELQRYEEWKGELDASKNSDTSLKRSSSSSISMSEIPRSRIPEKVRPKSGNFSDVNMKSVMDGSVYDDLSQSTESIDDKKQLTEVEKVKRYRTLIKKQEQLLRVAFFLLLNIAEDENVEEKMTKKSIVELLTRTLEREHEDLLVLVLTFLKKLSIMQINKDDIAEHGVLDQLPRLLQSGNVDVVHLTLKLLYNLSFDGDLRLKMVKLGFLPKFVGLLSDDKHQDIVIKLLYHLSYDDEVKAQFAYTDCVSLIVDMLLLSADDQVDQVMVALCINLATNNSNAQQMADNNRLHGLMTRAIAHEDFLLMKMVHNLAEHSFTKANFIEFVGDLAKAATESKNEDFVLECVGVLSNLHLPDLDWAEIFRHFEMTTWIKNILKSNNNEPDLILQVIVLLGTAVQDEGCSVLLCKSDILTSLIDLLKTHQEDDEMVLQIIYVFMVILSHPESIDFVINDTEAPAYLIDLLQDNNKGIRKTCNMCLDMIAEHNLNWGDRIKIERFRNHNAQWLQMVDSQQLEPEDEEEDLELPPYLNKEYLSTSVVPPLSDINNTQESELIPRKELDYDYFERPDSNILQDFEMESM